MPTRAFGAQFRELSKTYGDVVYLNILGREFICLGSYKAANDLLDKRSSIYSGRVTSVMADMCGFLWNSPLLPYGAEWRLHRRTFHQFMNSEVVPKYWPIQTSVTRTLARRLLDSPQNWRDLVKFSIASSIMSIVYGIELDEYDDKYFDMIEHIAEAVVSRRSLLPPSATSCTPFLTSLTPQQRTSVKGRSKSRSSVASWKAFLKATKSARQRLMFAKECVPPCTLTNAALGSLFLAMTLYPDVQKKAQAELDAVVGSGRLPEFDDMDSLPYIRALVKELWRWHVVTPIGIPHTALEDDEYNGYTMPEGASILVNVWSVICHTERLRLGSSLHSRAISRDPDVYPDPEHFVPERFLDKDGKYDVQGRDPTKFIFGFGRRYTYVSKPSYEIRVFSDSPPIRICPGRHFAENTLLMACATLLWTFDISPPIDANGDPVEVKYEVSLNTIVS
ncbi:cytochrome P450 [Daedaleopsis nitida]|nr:cytochrome P450 [Daedaleopsis nitida]